MKTIAIAFLLMTNIAFADVYSEAIQQAHNVANGQPPQGAPPAQPSSPATPPPATTPPNPALEATLQNIANLRYDFDTLGDLTNSTDTNSISAPKQSLLNDLAAAPQSVKPPQASISKLADDLVTTTLGREELRPQHQKMAQDIHAIFNSSQLTPSQQQMIFDGIQSCLQDGGTSSDETTNIVSDIQTIATETK
jgi:hypothetical protein